MSAPFCRCCGLPLPPTSMAASICGACIAQPPSYDAARSALRYDDASRPLIHAFKYSDRHHLRPLFLRWLRISGGEMLETAELIVPVPLSRRKLVHRMFNQSALLAQGLARQARRSYAPTLLVRVRHTPPQAGLSRKERKENLKRAFAVRPGANDRIEGKRVLLIDDVMTTGATAEACAEALKKAGAARVEVLTLARVVMEG